MFTDSLAHTNERGRPIIRQAKDMAALMERSKSLVNTFVHDQTKALQERDARIAAMETRFPEKMRLLGVQIAGVERDVQDVHKSHKLEEIHLRLDRCGEGGRRTRRRRRRLGEGEIWMAAYSCACIQMPAMFRQDLPHVFGYAQPPTAHVQLSVCVFVYICACMSMCMYVYSCKQGYGGRAI